LQGYKQSVPAPLLASVLLLAACWQASLSGVCSMVRDAPSHETVRKALLFNLPGRPRSLLGRWLAAFRAALPPHLRAVPQPMALDLHQRPYYGRFTRGCTRRERKKGTRKSFTYATLAVLGPTGRFTVGLLPTRPFQRLTTLLGELLGQAAEAGLSVSYLLMDKEFYAAEVIDWLQRRGIAFVIPALKRGRKEGGGNRHLFAASCRAGWYDYEWVAPLRRRDFRTGRRHKRGTLSVRVQMCVAHHARTGKAQVYACGGLKTWPPAVVAATYRRRFGIEAKYRQLGQCLARTSSRDERVRLMLVGLALLLCSLWAYLHSEVFGTGPLGERQLHLDRLRLTTLVRALVQDILALFGGVVQQWQSQRQLPQVLAHS
jgi:putative transposase